MEVGEGQLGQVVEGADQLAGLGVWLDLAGQLYEDPELGFAEDDVEGDQRAAWVLIGGGDEEAAFEDHPFEQRRFDFHGADLGRFRAALPGHGFDLLGGQLGLGAGAEPFGLGGVDSHSLGQRDYRFLDRRGGVAVGVEDALVVDVDVDV